MGKFACIEIVACGALLNVIRMKVVTQEVYKFNVKESMEAFKMFPSVFFVIELIRYGRMECEKKSQALKNK